MSDRACESIVLVRDLRPGQVIRVTLLTTEQARALPALAAGALQVVFAMQATATVAAAPEEG